MAYSWFNTEQKNIMDIKIKQNSNLTTMTSRTKQKKQNQVYNDTDISVW